MKLRISTFIIISSALLNMAFGQQKTGEITSVVENKLIHQNGFLPVDINEKALLKAFSNKSESVELPYLNELRPFKLVQFSIYPGDANPHPEIKTYKLYSKTDKTISGRVTTGPGGINIMYLTKGKMIRIYPDHYEANKSRNYVQEVGIGTKVPEGEKYCTVHESHYSPRPLSESSIKNVKETLKRNGSIRRIYRVAVMCTGEYAELNGGGARQLMISNLSDISAIYEKDMSFELEMAIGAPRVNSDRDTDPFIPANGNRPGQAQDAISAAFPVSRYDIGHVFHRSSSGDGWDSGGVAGLGVICNASRKASGWSGSSNNTSNSWIQLAAHEFGHMFDSPHTFNGDGSSCEEGNHPINTAYEIGSGTTIMSYQGICASEYNIPASGVADNYFHVNSLNRMVDYAENFGICNDENWIVDNNNEPVANANPCGATFSIPRLTPFMMIGEATDADGDALTYNWEQYDEDGTGQRPTHGLIGSQAADSNTAPLYRSYPPNSSPIRVIPTLDNLRNNISSPFEVLTRRSRDINFRFVVRDNNPVGGAIDWDQIKIRTTATKGPLSLTSPENSEIVQAGSELEVTWNTRNSDDLCEKAVIRLSVDGGLSFPFDIAKDIDYAAGSAMVVIPASFSNTEQARIMIACDDYECFTFFDITNRNFSIESNCFAPGSLLCDDSDGTYLFGAPELDFDEDVMDGTSVTSITGPLEALETIDLTINDINNNCTIVNGINNPYQAFNFSVTLGGSYKFTIDDSIDGALTAYTIFDGDTFNPLNPCNSFIASNANWVANSYGYFLEFDVVLEPCKNYILVATVTNSMSSDLSLVDVEGPGLFIVSNLTADYELTFLAFDANTEVITAVSADADFTTLAAGEYYIKSAYYKVSGPTPPNNVDPTTLIGLTESELLGGIDCILPSGNEKEIIIEASCFVNDIIEVSRTTCDPLTNTYDITLSFTVDMGPETGMVTINGQAFPLSGTDATVTLTDLVSNGEFVDLDFVFSDDQGCNRVYEDVFQAPMNCCPITIELGQDRTLCAGDIEVLDGGTDGIMYEWFKNGEATGDDTQTIEVTEEGEYSVLVTNSTGCVNQEAVFLDFAPLPSVELSETEIDACIGQIVEVEVTTNVNNIEWFYEGTSVSVDQVILEVSEPGNYSVVVTSMFGCTNTATFSAVFKDSPEIDIGDDILTCNGSVITLDAGLSGPQYLYEWKRNFIQNVGTDQTTDIVTFGTYSVTVTDTNNGCESLDTIGVDYEPLPEFDFGRDKTRCEGDFYVIEAEESAFEIEWYFNDELIVGENDIELTAMEQGEYVGIVNQNSQCIESDTLFVTYLDAPDVDFPDMISACPGEIIDLVVDDLNATFIWSSEADGVLPNITNSLSVTTSGTYYVAASSTTTFCPANDTIVVNFSEVPELDLGEDVTGCEGTPVILSSETNGFMVDWYFNNQIIVGANTSTLEVTQAGEYRISIDEGGTCVSEDIVNVTFAPSPTVNLGDDRSACPGDVVVLDAGDPSATYVWESAEDGILLETSNILEVTEDGVFTVTATKDGCSTIDMVEITFTDLPILGLGSDISNCEDEIYTIVANSEGFDLEWYYNGTLIAGVTDDEIVADQSGEYIAKVNAGPTCSVSDTINVTYNLFPTLDLGDDRSACPGDVIALTVDDLGHTYQWLTITDGILSETSNVLEVTESGTYICNVTTDDLCTVTDTVRIDFTPLPILSLGADVNVCQGVDVTLSDLALGFGVEWFFNGTVIAGEDQESLSVTESGEYIMKVSASADCSVSDTVNVTFFDAPVVDLGEDRSACPEDDVFLDGGDASNVFVWSAESQGALSTDTNLLEVSMSDIYYVEVTNAGNCTTLDTVQITFTELPTLDLGQDINDVCEGADLVLNVDANGFATSWTLDNEIIVGADDEMLQVTQSGTYIVTAEANASCSTSDTIEVNLVPAPQIDMLSNEVGCEGTTVTLTVGNDGDYQFIWQNETGILQDSDVASLEVSASGIYTVEAIDGNNCVSRDTSEVTFIAQPEIELDSTLSFCRGGSAIVLATSNVTVIEWYQDGYLIEFQDDTSLDIEVGGEYVAVVGSGTACEARDTIVVTTINDPVFSIVGNESYCSDELPATISIFLDADETVQWFNGSTEIPSATNPSLEITESGEYIAVVTNTVAGCFSSQTLEVAVEDYSTNTPIPIPTLCEGETFTMEFTTTGTSFEWRDESGAVLNDSDLSLDIVASGEYAFVSFNSIGCETVSEFEVTFRSLPEVELGEDQTACAGTDIVFEIDHTIGYTYTWSRNNSVIVGENSSTLTVSESGDYSVEVRTSIGCTSTDEVTVTFFDPPELVVPNEQNFCTGTSATISISTNADIIRWNLNGNIVANDITTFDVLTPGTYIIEVESDDGCIVSEEVVVNEVSNPIISINDIELCPGESEEINIDANFESYFWDGITASGPNVTIGFQSFTSITTENASLTVEDQFGCSATEEFTITYFPPINAMVLADRVNVCQGESVTLEASGGLFYNWTDVNGTLSATNVATPIASPSANTTYTVQVSDNCPGNVADLSVEVIVNDLPEADAGQDTCAIAGLSFELLASGGTSYSWDNTDLIVGSSNIPNPIIELTTEATFTVTVTDENGCRDTDDVEICILEDPTEVLKPVTLITPNGDSFNDALEFRGLEAYPDNVLTVFNRWGNIIFKKRGYQNDELRWDGTRDGVELPADTYYYILEFSNFKIKKSITLLRN